MHKPVTKNSENKKKHARFKDNIWAADLAEMRSLSYFNCGVKYLVYVIDIFTKYTWVKHFKDKKKLKNLFYDFIEILNESKQKPNKLWVTQGKDFYNNLMQKWWDDNEILMCSTHNEGKSRVAKRFTRTFKGENL